MENINYKELDRKRLIAYLADNEGVVDVKDLLENSGADQLRVFPLLFELSREGAVEVLEEDKLGAPEKVRLLKGSAAN